MAPLVEAAPWLEAVLAGDAVEGPREGAVVLALTLDGRSRALTHGGAWQERW